MTKQKISQELETLIRSNLFLVDCDDSIKKLRIGATTVSGVECIAASPDNDSGYLGFSYNALTTPNSIKSVASEAAGITQIHIDKNYFFIHSSKKTWPKDLKYEKIDMDEYNSAIGHIRALDMYEDKE